MVRVYQQGGRYNRGFFQSMLIARIEVEKGIAWYKGKRIMRDRWICLNDY